MPVMLTILSLLLVHQISQFPANLKMGKPLRSDIDNRAGLGVTPPVGSLLSRHKGSESSDFNPVALLQTHPHLFKNGAHDNLCRAGWNARSL